MKSIDLTYKRFDYLLLSLGPFTNCFGHLDKLSLDKLLKTNQLLCFSTVSCEHTIF